MSSADAASIASSTKQPSMKSVWCETQWTTLSRQAQTLGLPKLPYFEPVTMRLSKEVNKNLWQQLGKLYNHLGPERAPHATPVMLEGGEIQWHSYLDGYQGDKADIFNTDED